MLVRTDDALRANWIDNPYEKPPKKKHAESMRIHWVMSPPSSGGGGHQNIMRFVEYLESQGHTCKLFMYSNLDTRTLKDIRKVFTKYFPGVQASISKINKTLGECDALFATGWETAYPVFNAKGDAHKFYFIQDFEPLFYPMGSEYVLAENTYKFGFHGITAGGWLDKKVSKTYGMDCDHYDFATDNSRYSYTNSKKRKKIFFYARPVTLRRGFELGVMALDLFKQKHPEYEIIMAGWDVSGYKLPFKYENRGNMRLDELNNIYNECAAALVLSLTNMSLLPLELLSSGVIPIVNTGENNSLVSDNPYLHYVEPTPQTLANALSETVRRKDLPAYAQKASDSVQSLTWQTACGKMEAILKRELYE